MSPLMFSGGLEDGVRVGLHSVDSPGVTEAGTLPNETYLKLVGRFKKSFQIQDLHAIAPRG